MNKQTLDFVIAKTHELINAPSCSKEAKNAAQNWLNAIGTDQQTLETQKYITELEADIMPIDGLIDFAKSPIGIQIFGEDKAKKVLAHAQEIKAQGAIYCDCPACKAVAAILSKKEEIL